MPDEFETVERAFWKELFDGMPKKTRALLEKNISLVQDAVILGTLLDVFFWEERNVGCGEITIKALPKFITYRIPLLRGMSRRTRSKAQRARWWRQCVWQRVSAETVQKITERFINLPPRCL